jgi:hypothetical protein
MAEFDEFGLSVQEKDPEEETLERSQMLFSEIRNGVVIGVMTCGAYPEGDIFVGLPCYLSGRRYPPVLGIEEQLFTTMEG